MLRHWCRVLSLSALILTVASLGTLDGAAQAQCCGRPPVQDAGPLAVTGPTSSPAHKLVELLATGDLTGKAIIWDVYPEETADVREIADGRLIFTGPPGTYRIKLRALRLLSDGATAVETVRHTVTIDRPAVPQPPVQPPVTPPVTPPEASRINPERALSQIKFPTNTPGQMSMCTATVVHPRRADGRWDILTAAHCVPGAGAKGVLTTRDRTKTLAVTVASIDTRCDLCWLVTDEPVEGLYCAKLATGNPAVGTAVWHAGYGVDKPENREEGTVRASENGDGQTQYFLSVSSGDSGGGIFDARTGELLSAVCCTARKAAKTDMWGGSPRQAARLRPTSSTSRTVVPHTIPDRSRSEFIPAAGGRP